MNSPVYTLGKFAPTPETSILNEFESWLTTRICRQPYYKEIRNPGLPVADNVHDRHRDTCPTGRNEALVMWSDRLPTEVHVLSCDTEAVIEPGEAILLNNYECLHRKPEGSNRWFIRLGYLESYESIVALADPACLAVPTHVRRRP